MTDIAHLTPSSVVTVRSDIIVKLDRQVGHLEEKLSQATHKINLLTEEHIRLQTENAEARAKNILLEARIMELEHRLDKTVVTEMLISHLRFDTSYRSDGDISSSPANG